MSSMSMIRSTLAAVEIASAAVCSSAIAGPNGPTVANSEIFNRATAGSVAVEGIQGSTGGGGGKFKFGKLSFGGSGSKSQSSAN